jgi:hypothetical protein
MMPATHAKILSERIAMREHFVRMLTWMCQIIGTGRRASRKSVAMLTMELKSLICAKTCRLRHLALPAPYWWRTKMKVPSGPHWDTLEDLFGLTR